MNETETVIPRECPACNSTSRNSKGTKNGFDIYVCAVCTTIYTDHVPADSDAQDYDDYYDDSNLAIPGFVVERVGQIVDEFAPFRRSNRLLDIGFGAGTVLKAAEERNWDVSGIEVSKPAFDHVSALGFDVFHGGLRDAGFPDAHFDVITASEILEHLPEPEQELKEIARVLRPGGLFWATTPHAQSISFKILGLDWSILSPPEHLQLYSRSGIRKMLRNAGFAKIEMKTHGLNPTEILNRFRSKSDKGADFNRVDAAYELNASLSASPIKRLVKTSLNGMLNFSKFGDSLKIFAVTKG